MGAMILILFGENELAIRRRMQELKDEADGGTGMLTTNLIEFDGRDSKPGEVIGAAMSPPFLAPKRLVVVEHLLSRFESRGSQRASRSLGPWESLPPALAEGIPDSTILVFLGRPFLAEGRRRSVSKTNPLIAALKDLPDVSVEEAISPVNDRNGQNLTRYIREEAALRGIRFRTGPAKREKLESWEEPPREADPAELMANLLQNDTLAIANELDKIALWAGGEDVDVLDVQRLTAGDREANRFQMVDALMDGNLPTAWEMMTRLKRDGEALPAILGTIIDRYRTMAQVVDLVEAGAPEEQIGKVLGNAGKFEGLRRAAIERARRIGPERIRQAYAYLVEADRGHKLGEADEEQAMDLLLMRLAQLQRPAPATAGRRY